MGDVGEWNQMPAGGEGVKEMSMGELERINPIELANIVHGVGETYKKLRKTFSDDELAIIQGEAMQIIARLELDKVSSKK